MTAAARPSGWLGPPLATPGLRRRAPAFDVALIAGSLVVALAFGAVASPSLGLFGWALSADLWLLAYPHVASTFSRVAVVARDRHEHRFLLLGLPPIVLAATAGAAWAGGAALVNTIYYYAQSYHYAKQSYGIARAYGRAAGEPGRDWLSDAVVFVFPIWGVLHRASQAPLTFYGSPLWSPHVPRAVALGAGVVAAATLAAWTLRWGRSAAPVAERPSPLLPVAERPSPLLPVAERPASLLPVAERPATLLPVAATTGHDLFVLSHVVVTVVAYVALRDVTHGWLVINVWHNAQYLLFVWARNAKRFEGEGGAGGDGLGSMLARLCRPDAALAYVAGCLGASTVFYLALTAGARALEQPGLELVLICHQAVNFHHYIVDAVIWRRRRGA